MYKLVSDDDYETVYQTINLTNIISLFLHFCLKTYFKLLSHRSPTPFFNEEEKLSLYHPVASISVSGNAPSAKGRSGYTPSPI